MFKRFCATLFFCIVMASATGAQDRIAVLDTVLPKGIDAGVIIPVTEKIMEEYVRSKLFIVLDRSFIAKTLSEQEFSSSDLTSGDSAKLASIGGFLRATYIVVSTVQKLETRFFLSAKMIEVKSGVIIAQSSVDRDGSISVLIDMAGELGRKLVAASMGQDVSGKSAGKAAAQPTQTEGPARVVEQNAPREPGEKGDRFSTASVDAGTGIFGDFSGLAYGASAMMPSGLFYMSAGASLIEVESDEYYSSYYADYFTDYYSDLDIYVGAGVDIMLGRILAYVGPRISYTIVSLYSLDSWGDQWFPSTWSGIGYGLELGADLRLGSFALGLRYSALSGDVTDDTYGDTLGFENSTFMLRASYAF